MSALESRTPRVGERGLRAVSEQLSQRDGAVLESVAAHRFLTTRQIEALHFHDHGSPLAGARTCRRVLRRLHALGLLAHLQRRVGGVRAGSSSFIWCLGPVGDRLRRMNRGEGVRQRVREPSPTFVDHCLAVADAHLSLVTAERAGQLQLAQLELEPDCWRHYLGPSGGRETLRPDLFAVTVTGEYEDHWFLEIDRGTESLPTIVRKCRQYEAYRRTGLEQEGAGVFPIVVWVVPTPSRQEKLREAIVAARGVDAGLHRVVLPAELVGLISGGGS